MVRAKFRCEGKETLENGCIIHLSPVTSGSEENEKFFKYTPFGEIKLGVVNEEASKQFVSGKEYYVDFTSVEEYKELLGEQEGTVNE